MPRPAPVTAPTGLVAGLLGMKPDDLRIPYAYQEAKKRGLEFTIDTVELRDAHPNTAVIETWDAGGKSWSFRRA